MWDAIIVGGGLAGLVAGIRAQERGKNILMISEGIGSLLQSSGVINYGRIEKLKALPGHPYAKIKEEIVQEGWSYFQGICPGYTGVWEKQQPILTPLGSVRQVSLTPSGLQIEQLHHSEHLIMYVPQGLKDFFPDVVSSNIQKEFPGCRVEARMLRVPEFEPWHAQGKPITGLEYASFWRSPQGQKRLQKILEALTEELLAKGSKELNLDSSQGIKVRTAVLMPGLASLFSALEKIRVNLPFPVLEMTGFPPGPHGRILYDQLVQTFKKRGGELLLGSKVLGAKMQEGICQQVYVQSKGKNSVFHAAKFVLATGGLLGGGLEVAAERKAVRERVLNLPVYISDEWANPDFLGKQPYAYSGIEVNEALQPVDYKDTNIFVVGRALAYWDPWSENCAGGVSITSGYYVGEML